MSTNAHRMACAVKALRIRLDDIVGEMQAAERARQEHYRLADHLLDEFDDLSQRRFTLTRALWKAEQALAEAAFAETAALNDHLAAASRPTRAVGVAA